jgi:hypothetical protein
MSASSVAFADVKSGNDGSATLSEGYSTEGPGERNHDPR